MADNELSVCTLGGKGVVDPAGDDPTANYFHATTGAGTFGHGVFLLASADYDAVVDAAGTGTAKLVMRDQRGDVAGAGVAIDVYVGSGMPYAGGKAGDGATLAGVVAVTVFDRRYAQDAKVTKAFNVQPRTFPYSGTPAAPKFVAATRNAGADWTWADLVTDVEGLPTLPTNPSWKPRNVIVDRWPFWRLVDWLAAELFIVTGWDYGTNKFTYHAPGVATAANAVLAAAAKPLLVSGSVGKRNTKRLPKKIAAVFRGAVGTFDANRSYERVVTVNAGGTGPSSVPLHVGSHVAVRGASDWLEKANLDAVGDDLAARAHAFINVPPAVYAYAGIVPLNPDGKYRDVLWQSGPRGATTRVMCGVRFDWQQSANSGLWGFADQGDPPALPRVEYPSDQLVVGLGGANGSVSPAGTRYLWGDARDVTVSITEAYAGGGKYGGYILAPPAGTLARTGTLTAADCGTATDAPPCVVFNAQEIGSDTHRLTVAENTNQRIYNGRVIGVDADGVSVVLINGQWFGPCDTTPPE